MKICVITCHNIKNYGSVLQTYATQVLLENLGYEVEIIDYQREGTDKKSFKTTVLNESNMAKNRYWGKIMPIILWPSFIKMNRVFESFSKQYINLSPETYFSNEELVRDAPQADIYVSGSDQIWNSTINCRIEKPYLLAFVPDDIPKMSISSSFGKDRLDEDEIAEMKTLLSRYLFISVREKSGVDILQSLGINGSYYSVDPTFFLNKELWSKLKVQIRHPKKYILIYQLHRNEEFDDYIKEIEKYYKMPCVRVTLYYHYVLKGERIVVSPTPGQWIYLIENADYIVSDSFHMTVFSIMFHKKFVSVYSKGHFNGRIKNILELTNLENRHISNFGDIHLLEEDINFNLADKVLEEKRMSAISWIKDSLNSIKGHGK